MSGGTCLFFFGRELGRASRLSVAWLHRIIRFRDSFKQLCSKALSIGSLTQPSSAEPPTRVSAPTQLAANPSSHRKPFFVTQDLTR